MAERLLSGDEANLKCKMGQRERCCKFLVVGMRGFECMYVDERNRAMIDANWRRSAHVSQAGPCADPFDSVSEAVPKAAGA